MLGVHAETEFLDLAPLPEGLAFEFDRPGKICNLCGQRAVLGRRALCNECALKRGGGACGECALPAGRLGLRKGRCDTCYKRQSRKRKRAAAHEEPEATPSLESRDI